MTKEEFIQGVGEIAGSRWKAGTILGLIARMMEAEVALKGLTSFPDIGKFVIIEKPARLGRNPRTGEEINVPAKRRIKFRPAKALKDLANKGA